MELEVKERIIPEDGLHKGAIIRVEYRNKPFDYIDFVIEIKKGNESITLKAGYSQFLSKQSKLGLMLQRFGVELNTGAKLDPAILIGKKCQFLTMSTTTTKGKFANITPESVKPIER